MTTYGRPDRRYLSSLAPILTSFLAAAGIAQAQPGEPVYSISQADCVTSDNQFVGEDGKFYWDVDTGCDTYQSDVYERPTTQSYFSTMGRYGAVEYFEYLDLTGVQSGFDSQFLYVELNLAGRNHLTSDGTVIPLGMIERYGFRISTDPDGRFGLLIVSDQPELKNAPNTSWGSIGTFGYRDTNGDVGGAADSGPTGLTVSKSDNPDEVDGLNGYETPIISDGRLSDSTTVLWVRLSPTDSTKVELALDYQAVGFTEAELAALGYFHFETVKGGPKDPQNYLWNDKYTKEEAGSPNPGCDGKSEFCTEGLKDIYEVDTVGGGSGDGGGTDNNGNDNNDDNGNDNTDDGGTDYNGNDNNDDGGTDDNGNDNTDDGGTGGDDCEADANDDGTVDPLDVGYVLSRFGCSSTEQDDDCDDADVNDDGAVDPLDAGYVLARFGPCEGDDV